MSSRSFSVASSLASALAAHRRGFAAATAAVSRLEDVGEKAVAVGKKTTESLADSLLSSWVPDPVTGYYRPADRRSEIDPAELRELLLRNRRRN